VFVQIGLVPNTEWLEDSGVALSRHGEIEIDARRRPTCPACSPPGDVTTVPVQADRDRAWAKARRRRSSAFDYIIRNAPPRISPRPREPLLAVPHERRGGGAAGKCAAARSPRLRRDASAASTPSPLVRRRAGRTPPAVRRDGAMILAMHGESDFRRACKTNRLSRSKTLIDYSFNLIGLSRLDLSPPIGRVRPVIMRLA
jgi:hypothetical protein